MNYGKNIIKITVVLTVLVTCLFGQLPYEFTEIFHYDHDNCPDQYDAHDVVVINDSLIFTAFGHGGLYVHELVDSHLVYLTHLKDSTSHQHLLATKNGTIFSATSAGIHAYRFYDQSLHEIAFYDTIPNTNRMIEGPDSTVFVAQGTYGIKVYDLDGLQLTERTSLACGRVNGMVFNSQSQLFIANGDHGVSIADYDGDSIIIKKSFEVKNQYDRTVSANDIALMNDSLFCFISEEDLFVYSWLDTVVAKVTQTSLLLNQLTRNSNNIIISETGKIFVSLTNYGIFGFSFNGTDLTLVHNKRFSGNNRNLCISKNILFHTINKSGLGVFEVLQDKIKLLDYFNLSSEAFRIDKGSDGYLFVAMKSGGFQILKYRNDTFEFIAKGGYGDKVMDISVTPNCKYIAVACWNNGLKVYSFIHNKLNLICHALYQSIEERPGFYSNDGDWTESSSVEFADNEKLYYGYLYQGIFLGKSAPSIRTPTIKKYQVIDNTVSTIGGFQYGDNITHVNGITTDLRGNVFVALEDGYWELKYGKSLFSYNYNGPSLEFDISDDYKIYLASGNGGLKAYRYVQDFQLIDRINDGGTAMGIESVANNLVFLANGSDGLRAYTLNDSLFINQAHFNNDCNCQDVVVLEDSTIIIAEGYNGLKSFSYNGWSELISNDRPNSYRLLQNYPNPFNPSTTICYQLPGNSSANVTIYDILGRKIRQWSYQNQTMGTYEVMWDGNDRSGEKVPSGVYIYCLIAGNFVESKKMVLLK